MCGIFAYLNNTLNDSEVTCDTGDIKFMNKIEECFNKDKNRGPEKSTMSIHNNIFLGFHRLAINGLDNEDVRLSKRVGLSSKRLRGFERNKTDTNTVNLTQWENKK